MAVPVFASGELLGVLFVESPQTLRFSYDDEDALVALAGQLGPLIRQCQLHAEAPDDPVSPGQRTEAEPPRASQAVSEPSASGSPLLVRYYPVDGSVFFGVDYVIKGVAGSILWTLLQEYASSGRGDFTNRELRLDPRVRLPDVCDNLEARLVLLRQRLAERDGGVTLEKSGRGRLRLRVSRPLTLQDMNA